MMNHTCQEATYSPLTKAEGNFSSVDVEIKIISILVSSAKVHAKRESSPEQYGVRAEGRRARAEQPVTLTAQEFDLQPDGLVYPHAAPQDRPWRQLLWMHLLQVWL